MILNNILLNNRLSCIHALGLVITFFIEINLGNESIVAWNMRRYLSWANRKFINFVFLFHRLISKDVSWVVAVRSKWVGKFTCPSASGWAISLTIDGPEWASWLNFFLVVNWVNDSIISCLPMRSWVNISGNSFTRIRQSHLLECSVFITCASVHCWYLAGV